MIGSLFGTGIIIGFAIAAPVGPVGVLCAQRTITRGAVAGLVSGFGAAIADSIFGMIAAFGLSIVAEWIFEHQVWVRLVGGVFLLVLGIRILRRRQPHAAASAPSNGNMVGHFVSTFVLTITNPITILSFAGIFAAFGVIERIATLAEGWILVAGVLVGSSLWWLLIALTAEIFRRWISHEGMRYVSMASALIMLAFGVYALSSVIPVIGGVLSRL
ncbi:MAG: LysE family transporter [Alphaproteobacteria bacterium]